MAFYGSGTLAQYRAAVQTHLISDIRVSARRYRVGTVVVFPLGQRPAALAGVITKALGPPTHADGATVWYHVQHRLAGDRRLLVSVGERSGTDEPRTRPGATSVSAPEPLRVPPWLSSGPGDASAGGVRARSKRPGGRR